MAEDNDNLNDEEESSVDREIPSLKDDNSLLRKIGFAALVLAGAGYIGYKALSGNTDKKKEKPTVEHGEIRKHKFELPTIVKPVQDLYEEQVEQLEEPPPEETPPELSDAEKRRRTGPLVIYANKASPNVTDGQRDRQRSSRDDYLNTMGEMLGKVLPGGETEKEKTLNEQLDIANNSTVHATQIKDLSTKLLQGKMIGAILETAIQSDLSGMVRAEITEPVYSSNGKQLLIPQGSRVVGQYTGGLKNGQSRIFVVWQRVITPKGIDIALNSPGAGALGRAGHGGWVDSHFWERFGSSMLLSVMGGGTSSLAGFAADGNQVA